MMLRPFACLMITLSVSSYAAAQAAAPAPEQHLMGGHPSVIPPNAELHYIEDVDMNSLPRIPAAPAQPALAPTVAGATQQLQQMLGKKNSQEALGQAMALGILVNCTQKTAGKEATQAFYQQMQTVGENVKAACKQQNSAGAQQLVLATIDAKQNDPVLKSALTCYDAQSGAINGMAGQKIGDQVAHYARWARDPATAHREMKPTDICRGQQSAAK